MPTHNIYAYIHVVECFRIHSTHRVGSCLGLCMCVLAGVACARTVYTHTHNSLQYNRPMWTHLLLLSELKLQFIFSHAFSPFRSVRSMYSPYMCVCRRLSTLCLSIDDRNAHLFMSFNCAHCSAMCCCVWGANGFIHWTRKTSIEYGDIYMLSHCVFSFSSSFWPKKGLKGIMGRQLSHSHSSADMRVCACLYFSIQFAMSVVWWTLLTREQIRVVSHIVRRFNFYLPCRRKTLFNPVGNLVSACSCIPEIKVCLVHQTPTNELTYIGF